MSTTIHVCTIDNENNAVTFWGNAPAWASDSSDTSFIYLTDDQLTELRAVPGWSEPDAPKHAPHPILVTATWSVGDRAYHPADGGDTGRILEIHGDSALVGWDSGVRTQVYVSELEEVPRG